VSLLTLHGGSILRIVKRAPINWVVREGSRVAPLPPTISLELCGAKLRIDFKGRFALLFAATNQARRL